MRGYHVFGMQTATIIAETLAKLTGGGVGLWVAQRLWRRYQSRESRSDRQEERREGHARDYAEARTKFLEERLAASEAEKIELMESHKAALLELDARLHARHAEAISSMQAELRRAQEGRLRDHRAIVSGAEALGDTTEAIEQMMLAINEQQSSIRLAVEGIATKVHELHETLRSADDNNDSSPRPPEAT